MNSCTTCSPAGKQQEDEQLQAITLKAQAYAQQEKIPVAIYKENGEWCFCNAFDAYANRYQVANVVSQYSNTTP